MTALSPETVGSGVLLALSPKAASGTPSDSSAVEWPPTVVPTGCATTHRTSHTMNARPDDAPGAMSGRCEPWCPSGEASALAEHPHRVEADTVGLRGLLQLVGLQHLLQLLNAGAFDDQADGVGVVGVDERPQGVPGGTEYLFPLRGPPPMVGVLDLVDDQHGRHLRPPDTLLCSAEW